MRYSVSTREENLFFGCDVVSGGETHCAMGQKVCVCVCVCVTVQWDKRFRFYGLGFRVFAVQYGTDGLEFRV